MSRIKNALVPVEEDVPIIRYESIGGQLTSYATRIRLISIKATRLIVSRSHSKLTLLEDGYDAKSNQCLR